MLKQYLISESRLRDLLYAEAKLNALEAGGVDNWEWYGDSINDYFCRMLGRDIKNISFIDNYEEQYLDEQLKHFLEH